jgi:hypothetical protein
MIKCSIFEKDEKNKMHGLKENVSAMYFVLLVKM